LDGAFQLREAGTPELHSGELVGYSPTNLYNSVYSSINEVDLGVAYDSEVLKLTKLDTLVKYSDKSIEGDFYDRWCVYRANNANKAEPRYGAVNYMLTKNSNTFVFQDSAVSIAMINPLVQAPATSGEQVILGTGGGLERFTYISTDVGIQGINEAVESVATVYFLDRNKKKIYMLSEGLQSLTDLKDMNSWFNATINESSEFIGVYDNRNSKVALTIRNASGGILFDDIWFTVTASSIITNQITIGGSRRILNMQIGNIYDLVDTNGLRGVYRLLSWTSTSMTFIRLEGDLLALASNVNMVKYVNSKSSYTLWFSEKGGIFTSFESFIPSLYLKGYREFYSTNDNRKLFMHNVGNPMEYYGVTYPMILDIVVNGKGEFNKILSAFEFNAEVFSEGLGDITTLDWTGMENETLSEVNIKTNKRTTEYIPLYVKNGKTAVDTNENIASTVYLSSTRQLQDTSGKRIVPYPGYLYNIDTDHNKFRMAAPRVKVGRNDSDVKEITENIRGTYFVVRLIFNPNGQRRLRIFNIMSYFDTSVNF